MNDWLKKWWIILLIVIIIFIIILIVINIINSKNVTCLDSNQQCKGKPDGTVCETGVWCDKNGNVCGGNSCVGLGLGNCINETCR